MVHTIVLETNRYNKQQLNIHVAYTPLYLFIIIVVLIKTANSNSPIVII